jgi:predicted Ser/Thr protein kinase/Flp pilus assembly protein TadD
MPFVAGENVGAYRIVEQLGQGGMATVFKAYHAALDRFVAIKVLHPAFTQDPNFLARFQREARLVAKLDHPNIVPIYDYSEHEGRPYLVMKFIQGETLKARLARERLSPAEIQQVVDAMGAALSYAHQQGILHRDVKPSNVLLGEDGNIYLADFGLARMAQAGESTLSSDMFIGTPQYISPEQALGKSDLDEGTDIYSMGVVMYEIVVGRVPFSADTPYSIIHDHIYSPLPLPRAINPEVSEAVERVLLKALAKERADRFPDIASLVAAFDRAVAEQPGSVEEERTEVTQPAETLLVSPPKTAVRPVSDAGLAQVSEAIPAQEGAAARRRLSFRERFARAWRWWYLAPILAFCCLAGLVGVSAINTSQQQGAVGGLTPVRVATSQPRIATVRPVTTRTPDPAAIAKLEQAKQNVEQNPGDPYAYLSLAEAYWDAGEPVRALQTLNKAVDLAGEDARFYLRAGDLFSEREMWLLAAEMYVRMAAYYPGDLPEVMKDKMHQAVYLAAADRRSGEEIPKEIIAQVDDYIFAVALARYEMFFGNLVQAGEMVAKVTEMYPGTPEVSLLKAEYSLKVGEKDAAVSVLRELATGDVPEWVSTEARKILREVDK